MCPWLVWISELAKCPKAAERLPKLCSTISLPSSRPNAAKTRPKGCQNQARWSPPGILGSAFGTSKPSQNGWNYTERLSKSSTTIIAGNLEIIISQSRNCPHQDEMLAKFPLVWPHSYKTKQNKETLRWVCVTKQNTTTANLPFLKPNQPNWEDKMLLSTNLTIEPGNYPTVKSSSLSRKAAEIEHSATTNGRTVPRWRKGCWSAAAWWEMLSEWNRPY